jgi:mxaJ protein
MYLRCSLLAWSTAAALATAAASADELRVCADSDNLPFSNEARQGFENRIVEVVASALGDTVSYQFWDDRLAPMVERLNKGGCDLISGMLTVAEGVATTQPYMTSGYAFVILASRPAIGSFDEPQLRTMVIGVQTMGDEGVAPAAAALVRRGYGSGIRPYTFHGHYSDPNSSAQIVEDVANGTLDAAVLWGPFAGYFAAKQPVALSVNLVTPGPADLPMFYGIGMATRANDTALRDRVDRALADHRAEIEAIVEGYHVPLTEPRAAAK